MKTLVILGAFSDVTEGPGPESVSTYTVEILVMLIGAFILGYLLRYFLNSSSQGDGEDWKLKFSDSQKEVVSLKAKLANSGDLSQITSLKAEVSDLKMKLENCESSKLNVQSFASAPPVAAAAPITTTVSASVKDDLKVVEGIGPKIESLLNDAGILTFRQLANTSPDKIKEILTNAGDRYRIHDPGTWPKQSELAADGKWEELKALQNSLSAGK
jgi:predicted flap endonuclease-1-like 5' DNA nuclease